MAAALKPRQSSRPAPRAQGRLVPGPGSGGRKTYRIAICSFAHNSTTIEALSFLNTSGVSVSDVIALVASPEAGEAVSSFTDFRPAVFLRREVSRASSWVHLGTPASVAARQVGDLDAWASPWTIKEVSTELSLGHIALLILGLRPFLQALVTKMLTELSAVRLEVHDIPAQGLY